MLLSARSQVLRIQSATEGTKRVEVFPTATTAELYETVKLPFHLAAASDFALYRERNYTAPVQPGRTETIGTLGLKNGDFLYLKAAANPTPSGGIVASGSSTSISSLSGVVVAEKSTGSGGSSDKRRLVEDDVDVQLNKMPGTLARKRDPKLYASEKHHHIHYIHESSVSDRLHLFSTTHTHTQMPAQLERLLRALLTAGALGRDLPEGAEYQAHVIPCVPAQAHVGRVQRQVCRSRGSQLSHSERLHRSFAVAEGRLLQVPAVGDYAQSAAVPARR